MKFINNLKLNSQNFNGFILGFCSIFGYLALLFLLSPIAVTSQVINENVKELQNIDVEEHLGQSIPMDLVFTTQDSVEIHLGQLFNQNKPVILILAYYDCPMLCTLVLNGITQSVYALDLELGQEYDMITVSIDPTETSGLAKAKRNAHLKMLNKSEADQGWTFMVGQEENIRRLAEAVGFKYYYVEDRKEYAHPAVVFLLSEEGKISRYLYGIEYKPIDLKLGLLEASQGKVGSTIDKLILYCYHYDPEAKGYVVFATNIMKLGGLVTLLLIGLFLGFLWFKESAKKRLKFSVN